MKIKLIFLSILIVVLFHGISFSQIGEKQYNVWCIPDSAGIDFNSASPTVTPTAFTNSVLTGSAARGCATICDINGNLLFYSNGNLIWNRNHQVLPSCIAPNDTLCGNSDASQPAIIVPKPGSTTIFYVFTNNNSNSGSTKGIFYSKIDLTLDGGLGDIDPAEKNVLVDASSTEKLCGTLHANGNDIWIVYHQRSNNTFKAIPVTSAGVNLGGVVTSSIGAALNSIQEYRGMMKIAKDGSKLAMASWGQSLSLTGRLEIFNFNNTTGQITSLIRTVSAPFINGIGIFGVEFSLNNNYVYVTEPGMFMMFVNQRSKIHQINVSTGASVVVGTSGHWSANFYGIQMGSDGRIYTIHFRTYAKGAADSRWLTIINNPDNAGASCNCYIDSLFLKGKNNVSNFRGLPNCIFTNTVTSTFVADTVCFGTNTTIRYTGNGGVGDTYNWNFAGGTAVPGTGQGPHQVSWPAAGTYNVTLQVIKGTDSSVVTTVPVIVRPIPTSAFIASSPVCAGANSTVTYMGTASLPPAPVTYTWGFSGGTAVPGSGRGSHQVNWTTAGTYNVSLTVTENGCTSPPTTVPVIVNASPTSTFTADSPICSDDSSTVTYAGTGTPAATYTWDFGGGTVTSGSGQGPYKISWAAQGTYNITLAVSENGCTSAITSQTVVVNLAITASFTSVPPACSGDNAVISYTGNADSSATYTWDFDGGVAVPGIGQGPHTVSWGVAGLHNVTLTVLQNGCSADTSDTVATFSGHTVTITAVNESCSNKNGSMIANVTGGSGNFDYLWSTSPGDTLPAITNLSAGAYAVTVSDGGCVVVASANIINKPGPYADFSVNPEVMTIEKPQCIINDNSVSAATSFWDFGDSTYAVGLVSSHSYESPGVYTIRLVVIDSGGCRDSIYHKVIVKDIFTIYIPNAFTPNGDNINDFFGPVGFNIDESEFKMYIFDRWGEKIYETTDLNEPWDGTKNNKGSKADRIMDVYVYRIQVKEIDGKRREYMGKVTVAF